MRFLKRTGALLLAGILFLAGCSDERETNELAYRQYGINCLESGKYEEAVDAFQKALNQSLGRISDTEVDISFYKAKAQFLGGDTEGAIDTYTALIEYNGNAEAYYLRGSLYYSMGNEGQGEKDFQSALESDPANFELYMGIYETLTSYGVDADSYLQEALKIDGEDAESHLQKGRIYYLLGDCSQAEELLLQAVKEGLAEGYYYLADVYDVMGMMVSEVETAEAYRVSAEECFRTYLDSGAASAGDLYDIGMLQMQSGDYQRAVLCFEAALEMDDIANEQAVMKNLIIAYENCGDFASAKEWMKTYAKEYPEDESMENERIFLETR